MIDIFRPRVAPAETNIQTMKTIAVIVAALSALLSSCNTMEGVGRDMQEAGSAIESSAIERNSYR